MVTSIDATYRITTPLFCAGADFDRPEVRLTSFKGVLRFWWRALAWSRCGGDLGSIRHQENVLFGSTDTGQSRVLMRLKPARASRNPTSAGNVLMVPGADQVVGEGARYLGYGVMEAFGSKAKGTRAGQLTRACLPAPSIPELADPFEFTIQMKGRDLDTMSLDSLEKALIALGTLGGMGAKSRKGYGSLVLQVLYVSGKEQEEQWRKPQSVEDLQGAIASLGSKASTTKLPEFTALSDQARHVLVPGTLTSGSKVEPVELLDLVGRELIRFRSWGHNGKVLGGDSEKNFKPDHDLMKTDWGRRDQHPRRIAFGLPHNYGNSRSQKVGPWNRDLDRRASPLFIHIHECGATPVAVLSFLPARFLPKDKSDISVGGKQVRQTPEADLYRPVHEFLDRLLGADKRKEPFANVVEVRP